METQKIDQVIKDAKLWLEQNRPPVEVTDKYFHIDENGAVSLRPVPPGMMFDYRLGIFKKK